MIDLIKEIEKIRDLSLEGSLGDIVCRTCSNETIDKVLEILNHYNIITAPKEIKLSEIVDRLNNEHKETLNGNVIYEYKLHRNGWYNTDGTPYHISDISIVSYYYGKKLVTAISFTPKMTITKIDFGEKHKWLYKLWIAGTTIIDDLEGQDAQH